MILHAIKICKYSVVHTAEGRRIWLHAASLYRLPPGGTCSLRAPVDYFSPIQIILSAPRHEPLFETVAPNHRVCLVNGRILPF